ncbi:GGDEF domain-containing protein [Thiocapsa rosea]|uniref:diguanylate cyclase n=1 Tax=Thiocapsa rosea TaxID=69360 RepID=A0A495V5W4_9GAMM|nr:sensor domain-containing diguanylate cyclase [Thiocapsa rosea]RKT44786.1 PAS domain S-box-containing protein/diguanylate cyclase (GGDEF)-like protein [Thiocapsa rosea]
MEMTTLLVAGLAVSVATNIGMATVLLTRRTYPGFGYWVLGTFCRTLGGILILSRGELSPWLTVVLANVLLLADLTCYLRGLQLFRNRPTHGWAEFGLLLSFGALLAWLTFIVPSVNARIVVFGIYSCVVQIWALHVLLTHRPDDFGSGDRLQVFTIAVLTLAELTRAVYSGVLAAPITDFLASPPHHGPLILVGIMAILLLALSQIIMNAQRIEYDYRRAQRRLEEDIAGRERAAEALSESETRFRLAFDNANTGMALVDLQGRFLKVNERMSDIFGYTSAELEGMSVNALTLSEDAAVSPGFIARAVRGETESATFEKRYRHRLGHVVYGQVSSSLVRDPRGQPLYFISQVQDISERRQAEEALRRSLRELQRHDAQMVALNRMNERLLSCDGRASAYGIFAESAEGLFGPNGGGLVVVHEQDDALELVASWGERHGLRPQFAASDCSAFRQGGIFAVPDPLSCRGCRRFQGPPESRYLCVPLAIQDQPLGLLQIVAADTLCEGGFAELRMLAMTVGESIKLTLSNLALREALREQAIRDGLTGLFNRRYLEETLPRELARCNRVGEPLTVAMLDLDHFKRFNDTYGHEAGDLALSAVGNLLGEWVRGSDIVCRYGGEELMLILPATTPDGARGRLEELRSAVTRLRMHCNGVELPGITVSIGSAVAEPHESEATDLIRRADLALYRAKARGRNCVVAFGD